MEDRKYVEIYAPDSPSFSPGRPLPLGENEQVRLAIRAPAIKGRGVRILSLDGGGMRGLCTVSADGCRWKLRSVEDKAPCLITYPHS